jgi:uncharacterized protein (TIGR02118 family)
MVKALSFFKRRAGMSVEEFQAYWRSRHPDVVTKLPGVRRYVQSHTRPAAYQRGEPIYDGIAEVWFDDTAAMHALRGTAEVATVQADEARFIDRSTMGLIITDDHVITDGPALPSLRRYVQSHPRPSAYDRGHDPAWDGIALIWFDDSAALRAATTTPAWERAKADDGNFIAPGPVAFIITTEHVIVA